jgi:hypothetical protein
MFQFHNIFKARKLTPGLVDGGSCLGCDVRASDGQYQSGGKATRRYVAARMLSFGWFGKILIVNPAITMCSNLPIC